MPTFAVGAEVGASLDLRAMGLVLAVHRGHREERRDPIAVLHLLVLRHGWSIEAPADSDCRCRCRLARSMKDDAFRSDQHARLLGPHMAPTRRMSIRSAVRTAGSRTSPRCTAESGRGCSQSSATLVRAGGERQRRVQHRIDTWAEAGKILLG